MIRRAQVIPAGTVAFAAGVAVGAITGPLILFTIGLLVGATLAALAWWR